MGNMKSWMMGVLVLALILTGCSKDEREQPLVISTDTWIGLAPLYYAHAMGWLKEANIEFLQAKSIEENLHFYESHASDVVTGTVHEYGRLKKKNPDIIPIIIYDRSYGGDVILSNQTTQQLKMAKKKIEVYVELDTVGEDMLNYFLEEHNISKERLNIYSRSQEEIVALNGSVLSASVIAVTYNPHDTILKEHGFKEIANSKNDQYFIVDSFMATGTITKRHAQQIKQLKAIIDKGVASYEDNPKSFYAVVKPYFGDPSYEEFEAMRKNIQWINNEQLTPKMKEKLLEIHYPVTKLSE